MLQRIFAHALAASLFVAAAAAQADEASVKKAFLAKPSAKVGNL